MLQELRNRGQKEMARIRTELERWRPWRVPLFISLGPTLFFAVAWLYNLVTAIPYWRHGGRFAGAKSGKVLSTTVFHQIEQWGPFQWFQSLDEALLKFFSVDLSTVTTLVFLISSGCATLGICRLASGKHKRIKEEYFPFWPSFKTTFIQLGLLGTIFGFIIAFSSQYIGQTYDPKIIYAALGTSLYSTFFAAIWAYIIAPALLIPVLRSVKNRIHGTKPPPDPDIIKGFSSLRDKVEKADSAFARLRNNIEKTKHAISGLQNEFGSLDSLQSAVDQLSSIRKEVSELKQSWIKHQQESENRMTQIRDSIKDAHKDSEQTFSSMDQRFATIEKELRQIKINEINNRKISEIKKLIEELVTLNGEDHE